MAAAALRPFIYLRRSVLPRARRGAPPDPRPHADPAAERAARHIRLLDALQATTARPSDIRWALAELDDMNPTATECSRHLAAYTRLLTEGRSTAAAHAQRVLNELHEGGLFTADEVVSVSRIVLSRPEKKLLRSQLGWLGRAVRAEPVSASAAVRVLAGALETMPDAHLRARTARLITRHIRAADERTRAEFAQAPTMWDAEECRPLPPAAPTAPFRGPDSPAAVAQLFDRLTARPDDDVLNEQVFDGIVRYAYLDRPALTAALAPLLVREVPGAQCDTTIELTWWQRQRWRYQQQRWCERQPWSMLTLAAIAGGALHHPPTARTDSNPSTARIAEWGRLLLEDAALPPYSLATPTYANGQIDATALVERVREYESLGMTPNPGDFAQALVRTTPTTEPEVLLAADLLRSPDGKRLATWLRAGYRDANELPEYFRDVIREPAESRTATSIADYLLPIPEVQAAWLFRVDRDRLPRIAQLPGAKGAQVHRAVMHALIAGDALDRAAGVDALVTLATSNELRPDLLARALPADASTLRLAGALRAARTALGAHRTWPLLAALLPDLLTANPTPGLPELLALASECARRAAITGQVPGLEAVAQRDGNTRLARQARALLVALAPR